MIRHSYPIDNMDNDIFRASSDVDQNPIGNGGIFPLVYSNSSVQPYSLDVNIRNPDMIGFPLLSMLHGEMMKDLEIENHDRTVAAETSVSRNGPHLRQDIGDASVSCCTYINGNTFQEHFGRGEILSASSLANILVTSTEMQGNLTGERIATISELPMEYFRTSSSNGSYNPSMSSLTTSVNCGFDGVQGGLESKWTFDECMGSRQLAKPPIRTLSPPYHFIGNSGLREWNSSRNSSPTGDYHYGYGASSAELSLCLSTCQPSVTNMPTVQDQCSEISSLITEQSLHEVGVEVRLGSEQTSSNSKELCSSFGYYTPSHFSNVLSGSKYLLVVQKILAEVANYSLGNLNSQSSDEKRLSLAGTDQFPYIREPGSGSQVKLVLQRHDVEAKKSQLLDLLQAVDNRYNRCLNEIQTVVSAFNSATELDPQTHTRFALKKISLLYKTMREKITNHIMRIEESLNNNDCMVEDGMIESSFIQKQWALQHLRKDHPLWRPQRGLPEKAVSVLRGWMFQNFLHPYPKDTEKQLLAIKSGLTRNQVSNWFINARVRLWKPLIEEMYLEINNRKSRQVDNRIVSDGRSHTSFHD